MRFDGDIDIPVIDWRHYLEHQLDMHHSLPVVRHAAPSRARRGNHDNQVIWFTDCATRRCAFDQTPEAFDVIDEWMENLRAHPELGVAGNKPPRAVDRASRRTAPRSRHGTHVWDGVLDNAAPGACTQVSRSTATRAGSAGGPLGGRHLQVRAPVRHRGDLRRRLRRRGCPTAPEQARLRSRSSRKASCDWTLPDQGRPGA
jgi:hypothetical protein